MSEFETLMEAFVSATEFGRDARVEANMQTFGLNRASAELLDQISTGCVIEVSKLIGRRADKCADDIMKASVMLRLPEVLRDNMAVMYSFLQQVVVSTAFGMESAKCGVGCECPTCNLARAMSVVLDVPTQE